MSGPQPTGKPPSPISLTGLIFPWDGTQPVYIVMGESELVYLPLFSSEDLLRSFMANGMGGPIKFKTIKQVQDGREFLSSFEPEQHAAIRLIVDPHKVEGGKLRWTEVLFE